MIALLLRVASGVISPIHVLWMATTIKAPLQVDLSQSEKLITV